MKLDLFMIAKCCKREIRVNSKNKKGGFYEEGIYSSSIISSSCVCSSPGPGTKGDAYAERHAVKEGMQRRYDDGEDEGHAGTDWRHAQRDGRDDEGAGDDEER